MSWLSQIVIPLPTPAPPEPSPEPADWWHEMTDEDRAYASRPVPARPCLFCGGRSIHAKGCYALNWHLDLRMPFGKHRNKPLRDVPKDYLQSLIRKNIRPREADIREAIEKLAGAKYPADAGERPQRKAADPAAQKRRASEWFAKWVAFHNGDGDCPGRGYDPELDPRRPAVGRIFAVAAERLRSETEDSAV